MAAIAEYCNCSMHISVDVCLLSGKRTSLEVEEDTAVESLNQLARGALEALRDRLLNSSGEMLAAAPTVREVSIQSGDVLTLHVQQTQLKATIKGENASAFTALLGDGSVVTWGHLGFGGDSRVAQRQLKDVQQIQASPSAFAAILGDGSVVAWGDPEDGGDNSAVQEKLKDVQQIQASRVLTWGDPEDGGDSSAVRERLKDVQQIQASSRAFAAVLGDGSVITWGHPDHGGDSRRVDDWA